jgi:hypothetical protein
VANTGIAIPMYSTKNSPHFQLVHHMSDVDMFCDVLSNGRRVPILGAPFHKNLWRNGYKAPLITGLSFTCTVIVSDSHCRKVFSYKMSAL